MVPKAITLVMILWNIYSANGSAEYDYGFVIDAGSTGSRIYAYRWKPRTLTSSISIPPESRPKEYGERLTGPPISWITSLDVAKSTLIPLIEHVKLLTYSERSRWNEFPIYLKATAGMRLLDNTIRINIFNGIRRVFNNKTINPFLFKNSYSIIASGTEEATFDWLSVNYLKGVLNDDDENKTYGVLDLGGASTQLAFTPIPSSDIMDSFIFTDPFNYPFRLYAMSHLGYGANEIERQIAAKVYDENNNMNPCLFKGLNRTIDFIRYNGTKIYNITQSGTSDGILCEKYIKDILYLDQEICVLFDDGNECSLNGIYIPHIPQDMQWVGFKSFAYTVLADGHGITETSTIAEIYDVALHTICNYTFNELNIALPTLVAPETLCLLNIYIVVLLRDGYHFDINKRNILWTNNINGSTTGWQWGSILYDANLLQYTYIYNDTNNNNNTYKILTIIFVVLFGISLIIIIILIYTMKKNAKYQQIISQPSQENVDTDIP